MLTFPILKTGSAMQYPLLRTVQFSNERLQFVDGSEQAYRDFGGPLRQWVIQLELLDDEEVRDLEAFFTEVSGEYQEFTFTDPQDGKDYARCTVAHGEMDTQWTDELRGKTVIMIRQNRVRQ